MTRISLIAAVARTGVIGDAGDIPWRVPGEQARFKEWTQGHTLVMGRATFDSIGRPLPGRRTIVITRNLSWYHPGVETAHSLAQALALAGVADEVFVAGGGQIYAEALPFAHRLVLSEIDSDAGGDTLFPHWDRSAFTETQRTAYEGYDLVVYERVGT